MRRIPGGLALLSAVILATACDKASHFQEPATSLCMTSSTAQQALHEGLATATNKPAAQFIVKFKEEGRSSLARGLANETGAKIEPITPELAKVTVPSNATAQDVLSRYVDKRDIEFIEPDYPTFAVATGAGDPLSAQQWAHTVVHSQEAWAMSGGKDVIVGVIDTGIDYNHEDLAPSMWKNQQEIAGNGKDDDGNGYVDDIYGWDFANNDSAPMADDGHKHGTHVAGTIGATGDNGIGIKGHAPQVKLMALKYLDENASGNSSNAIKAIDYAVSMGAKILSNSWGSYSYSQALANAIEKAREKGVLFIAAAGNESNNNDGTDFYPANYPSDNIISVAATDSADQVVSWSNYGPKNVDIAAPGQSIYSTKNGNSYQSLSGTSMATPLVSGVAALVWSHRPGLGYEQVKQVLLSSAKKSSNLSAKVGSGRIDAEQALEAAAVLIPNTAPAIPPVGSAPAGTSPSTSCS